MSFVEVQPSTDIALKLSSTPARSADRSRSAGTSASVVSTASIVAMFGASIAAPLAMPPTMKPGPPMTVSLRPVSVVRIACAAAVPLAALPLRPATRSMAPIRITPIGRVKPMSPVEHTSTSSGRHPSWAATRAHISSASSRPCWPVAALAHPLLSTTAAA